MASLTDPNSYGPPFPRTPAVMQCPFVNMNGVCCGLACENFYKCRLHAALAHGVLLQVEVNYSPNPDHLHAIIQQGQVGAKVKSAAVTAVILNENNTPTQIASAQEMAANQKGEFGSGRFERHLNLRITKIMGDLLIVCGVISIIGGILETIGFGESYDFKTATGNPYSATHYAGYWCGALIIACGAVATHSSRHINDYLVIADVVAAVVGVVFAIVVLALAAQELPSVSDLKKVQDACIYSCGDDVSISLWLAAYALMIAAGGLGIIFGCVLAVFAVIAIAKSITGGNEIHEME